MGWERDGFSGRDALMLFLAIKSLPGIISDPVLVNLSLGDSECVCCVPRDLAVCFYA